MTYQWNKCQYAVLLVADHVGRIVGRYKRWLEMEGDPAYGHSSSMVLHLLSTFPPQPIALPGEFHSNKMILCLDPPFFALQKCKIIITCTDINTTTMKITMYINLMQMYHYNNLII